MSVRTLLIVALALVLGLSAAMGVNMFVSGRAGASAVQTIPVVTAAVAIPRGGMITAEQVKLVDYPRERAPAGAINRLEDAVERGVAIPLVPGDLVLDAKLTPKGAGRGLAALISKGMRAFTIQTPNVATGVAGFILPGNKVDVLLTVSGNDSDGTGGGSTTTLLQNVEILAVDQKIDAPVDNKMDATQLRSVTLLVTPNQAALLDLGQNKGLLHLSLRNLQDDQPARTSPMTMANLRFRQERPWDERLKGVFEAMGKAIPERPKVVAPPPAPEPPPKPRQIRTLRGLHEGRVTIDAAASEGR